MINAIVLAGAGSRRLGGIDKPSISVGGSTLLHRVVAAARAGGASQVVVVGPKGHRSMPPGVTAVEENPPGSGPAAAVASGLASLGTSEGLVIVLAGDLPWVGNVVSALVVAAQSAVAGGSDGAMVCADGRDQFLVFAASAAALRRAFDGSPAAGWPMRTLIERLDVVRVDVPADDVLDVDTWAAVVQARAEAIAREGTVMTDIDTWVIRACEIAGVDAGVDVDAILDLARDAAHGVARPAAPVTAYVLGYAAAARGLDAAGIAALAGELGRAALE